jgi:hypothetical protein
VLLKGLKDMSKGLKTWEKEIKGENISEHIKKEI